MPPLLHPVGKVHHIFSRHKLPFQKELLELRQSIRGIVGQIYHIIRLSFLVFITVKYVIYVYSHHIYF